MLRSTVGLGRSVLDLMTVDHFMCNHKSDVLCPDMGEGSSAYETKHVCKSKNQMMVFKSKCVHKYASPESPLLCVSVKF